MTLTPPLNAKLADELLPCPFCGEHDVGFGHTGQRWQTVACNECGAEGPCTEIEPDLIIQKWNTRTPALPEQGLDARTVEACAKVAESRAEYNTLLCDSVNDNPDKSNDERKLNSFRTLARASEATLIAQAIRALSPSVKEGE